MFLHVVLYTTCTTGTTKYYYYTYHAARARVSVLLYRVSTVTTTVLIVKTHECPPPLRRHVHPNDESSRSRVTAQISEAG